MKIWCLKKCFRMNLSHELRDKNENTKTEYKTNKIVKTISRDYLRFLTPLNCFKKFRLCFRFAPTFVYKSDLEKLRTRTPLQKLSNRVEASKTSSNHGCRCRWGSCPPYRCQREQKGHDFGSDHQQGSNAGVQKVILFKEPPVTLRIKLL